MLSGRYEPAGIAFYLLFSVFLLFFIDQDEFYWLFFGIAGLSLCYLILMPLLRKRGFTVLWIITRLMVILAFPLLSDDIYRFLWDGRLISAGINPYQFLPAELSVEPSLLPLLNSIEYGSVYPPICQYLFALLALFLDSPRSFALGLSVVYIITEYFLVFRPKKIPLFWKKLCLLHPLWLIEGLGNLHPEVLVSAIFIYALRVMADNKSYLLFILSGLIKLWPFLLLPFLKNWWKPGKILLTLILILVLSVPFYPAIFTELPENLTVYYNLFEFNASVYFIIRFIGWKIYGYNIIAVAGAALLISFFILYAMILWNYYKRKRDSFFIETAMWVLCLFLLFSTTVHPWYILPLIPLGLMAGYRFPLIWGIVIFLSYSHYSVENHIAFIVIEYLIALSAAAVEVYQKCFSRTSASL